MTLNAQNNTNTNSSFTAPALTVSHDDSLLFYSDNTELREIYNRLLALQVADPLKGIDTALQAIKKYEDEPLLAFEMEIMAQHSGNKALAKQMKEDNYRKFPFYLLIRCRYGFECLDNGKLIEAASAMNYKFDLKTLYPQRSDFHYLELSTFYVFVVRYFCELKDFNRAVSYFAELFAIDKSLAVISELRNIILAETLEQNLSPENIELLFTFGEDFAKEKNEEMIQDRKE